MVSFPNCKINLGLNVTKKRTDGYHSIETLFYPVAWEDALEIIRSDNTESKSAVSFTSSGIPVAGDPSDNLCVKAYQLLKKDFPQLPAVNIHLHKVIPMGAGLGGGSADGSFTLKMLAQIFSLEIAEETLVNYALSLGSDCPFFLLNKPVFAEGRGEKMTLIPFDLSSYDIVIIHPGIHVPTAEAFRSIVPKEPERSIKEIITLPITEWNGLLVNDFTPSVFAKYPAIAMIQDTLYQYGALYASLSGSGSAVYGIFEKKGKRSFSFPKNYVVYQSS